MFIASTVQLVSRSVTSVEATTWEVIPEGPFVPLMTSSGPGDSATLVITGCGAATTLSLPVLSRQYRKPLPGDVGMIVLKEPV